MAHQVEKVTIMKDTDTNMSKGFGFVEVRHILQNLIINREPMGCWQLNGHLVGNKLN